MESSKDPFFISIIMPTYNCETVLQSAVSSIIEQTFSNYEILCLDGESVSIPGLEKAPNHYYTHKETVVQHQNNTNLIIEDKFSVSLIAQKHINFFNQLHK